MQIPSPVRLSSSLKKQLIRLDLVRFSAWRERLVVWVAAACAGLVVVCFTWMTNRAIDLFGGIRHHSIWWPLILTPIGGMAVVWLTQRFAPGSAGSGIPQVMSALHPALPDTMVKRFVSLRLALAKIVLGASALLAGFSTGREGPSVQISASVMHAFQQIGGALPRISQRDLLLAGGAAGIAAAFNTPLAGIIFAIEELSRQFEQKSSGIVVSAIVLAGVVAISLEGNFTYFGRLQISRLDSDLIFPALFCALGAGSLGGLFSRLLIESSTGVQGCIHTFRRSHPVWFAGMCGFGIALLGLASDGAAHGSGYAYTREILEGSRQMPIIYVLIKFVATWLSYWSGVPGGIFAPSLAIGAGFGNDVSILFHTPAMPLATLGMVGFLAAATQAPITSFVIVMEMIDGHGMVLSLMATALLASLISRLVSPGLYGTLSRLQLEAAGVKQGIHHH
ncbi:chloride channel protein [Uliginosibacterium gangwonense]|uniref:chloride channel protein n=1 Tax=Uliginosibacterium gangwonense TaxID=392736 RepID=UPI00037390CA|nr:chloride channel protein [Uliginosibacterium gangwonense]